MEMSFADFEVPPARSLTSTQEKRLNRMYCAGDAGGGHWQTIKSLINFGFLIGEKGKVVLTEKASHYLFHHGPNMPI